MAKKLLFIFLLALCSCTQKHSKSSDSNESKINDFEVVCEMARNFDWSEYQDQNKARHQFADKVNSALPDSMASESIASLAEQKEKDPGLRYQLFVELAKEAGFTNYDCITLKDHF